jgi:hypothetical protein
VVKENGGHKPRIGNQHVVEFTASNLARAYAEEHLEWARLTSRQASWETHSVTPKKPFNRDLMKILKLGRIKYN